MATETPRDPRPDEERLGQAWDAFLAGDAGWTAGADNDLFATIDHLHGRDDVPALDAALAARIWRDASASAGIAHSAPLPSPAIPSSNGRHALVSAPGFPTVIASPPLTPPPAIRARLAPRWDVARWLSGFVRIMAIGAVAGMAAGAVGGGIVGRIAMRIIALMAEPWQQGQRTENGNRVGDITLGGSLELLVFTALVGIAGGIVYVLVRPWLPGTGLVRGAVFGALLLLSSGWLVMDPDNQDYHLFGVPGVNIVLFSLVYLVFGLIVAPLADRLDRTIPAGWPLRSRRVPVLVGSAVLILLAAPAILVGAGMMASPSGLLLSVLLLGTRALVPRWAGRFERPGDLVARPRLAVMAYAAIAIPALIGASYTFRAIGEILASG